MKMTFKLVLTTYNSGIVLVNEKLNQYLLSVCVIEYRIHEFSPSKKDLKGYSTEGQNIEDLI